MAQTITVSAKTFEEILSRLDKLTRDVSSIKARIFEQEPIYGSNAWWEWSDRKALESIRKGKGITIHSKKELDAFFKSL